MANEKSHSQEKLKAGQVPHDELVRVEKAHDVRTLRPCTGCEGITVDKLSDVGAALAQSVKNQAAGKTTVLEMMVTKELGDPFRRDALSRPVRLLDKYKDYV